MADKIRKNVKEIALSHAFIVTHAYKKYEDIIKPVDGWERVCVSEDLMGESKNGFQGALYCVKHSETKECKYVIAFCGFDDAGDIKNVIEAGFIGLPAQLEDAYAFTAKVCAEYKIPTKDLEFAGHSLGGYLAKSVASHWGAKAVWSFNSPGFKKEDNDLLKAFFAEKQDSTDKPALTPTIHNVNSKYDVVSRWGYQKGYVHEIETPSDHHNMRVMIEALSGSSLLISNPKPAGKIRLAARAVFDNIGKSDIVRNALDKIFRNKKKNPPENKL